MNISLEKVIRKFYPGASDSFVSLARSLSEFLLITIVVIEIGCLIYQNVNTLLISALEKSVTKSVRTVAFGINSQFSQEITELKTRARLLSNSSIDARELLAANTSMYKGGRLMGIVSRDGSLTYGDYPKGLTIEELTTAFYGDSLIKYKKKYGLFFVVPTRINGEPAALCERYDDETMRQKFRALSYNGDGTVILQNSVDDWTIITSGAVFANAYKELDDGWAKLKERYINSNGVPLKDAGAIYYRFHNDGYFLYFATVNEKYHFSVVGCAPWESVAVGIDYIYYVILITVGITIILLVSTARYILKARESRNLKREKILADSANRAKSEFLSNMSHEIRTPINAILGMDEMILRECKDESILEYARNLQNAGANLLSLINDILDFSKIEAGKMEIIPTEYEVSTFLNDLVNMLSPRATQKGLEFIVETEEKIPSVLLGDEVRLKQIAVNILTNAIKYTEHGSVTFTCDFEPLNDTQIFLKITVKDTGIGIKQADMPKLFSAFERIEEEQNRSIEGTGLGMNITTKLLALMGSTLDVKSIYGEGSVFSFKVAQKIVNPAPMGDFEEAYQQSQKHAKVYREKFIAPKAKILVVDDTVMNLTVVKGLLKQTQVKIDTAGSGFEALKLAQKNAYDIIFLDHRMPGMDGIETLQKMRQYRGGKNDKTPVISLTANAIAGAREEYIKAGFDDYLTKPINASDLENLVLKFLPAEKIIKSTDEHNDDTPPGEQALPDWLVDNTINLNTEAGIKNCGSITAYMDALTVFAESAETGIKEIENFAARKDWKNYTTKVHALKSSARIIGAEELSNRARRLEDAGLAGYIDEINRDTPALINLYYRCQNTLSPLLQKNSDDAADLPLISDAELAEAYETLRDFATNFDYDSMTMVLDSLGDYRLPEDAAAKITELKSAAAALNWDKVRDILRNTTVSPALEE